MGMAVKIWERIVEIEPLNFEALRFLVSWYMHQGSTSDIYKKGKLLLEADYKNGIKKDKEITQFMGKAFAAEFGIQNLEKDTSSLYWHLGTFYIKNNDYPLAVSAMNVALELNPNNIDALNNIAIAYFMMEDYAIALRWYKKCLSITPIEMYKEYEESLEKHDLKPTSWMGGIQAKEKIRQLIAQAESEILFGIGECLFLLNQTDDARDAFRKSVEKSEKFPHSNLTEAVEEILTVLQNKYR
jgi:tetratricopeptide (TPR) repeat protein